MECFLNKEKKWTLHETAFEVCLCKNYQIVKWHESKSNLQLCVCRYFYICSKQNNLVFFYLQGLFILISPDSQRLFLFSWYWHTTTVSTFLASGGFVPGELNTQRTFFWIIFQVSIFSEWCGKAAVLWSRRVVNVLHKNTPKYPTSNAARASVSNPCLWYLCRHNLDLVLKMDAEYCRWSSLLPLENYCCENIQNQSVHEVSSRLRPLEGKNKRI